MVSNEILGETLEKLYREYGPEMIGTDPIQLVRPYSNDRDREVAGWITCAFAYGRVDIIVAHVKSLLAFLGPAPARTLEEREVSARDLAFFRHRFHGARDAASLLNIIGTILRREGSIGAFFQSRFRREDGSVAPLLNRVVEEILDWIPEKSSALRYLFPKPADGSACKRWNLYLRWMIRKDGVDFGIWPAIPTTALVIPLDTHVHRIARRIGLTRQKTADWKTAAEITERLRRFDPADPVKYDFALCRLGILEICRSAPRLSDCPECHARRVCPVGRRRLAA